VSAARVALVAALVVLAACTKVDTSGQPAAGARHPWTIPGTLRVALPGNINTLNPILSTQEVETMAQALVFDPLVATDPEGNDVPVLASEVPTLENGGISADGKSITYHLRHNVKWQDGVPFTSRDVQFTFQAIMNPNTLVSTRHGYDLVDRVDTPDRYTAIFRLKRPFAPAVHTFFAHSDAPMMVLPAHLLARYSDLNRIPFNSQPIGTGPFKVVRWLRGDQIEYAPNDAYFLGKPKLRRIVLHFVADENTIVSEMRAHDLDWFYQATPRAYVQLRGIPGVTNVLVSFNTADSLMINTTVAPWSDARLRHALALAIDKPKLVQDFTYGTAIPATEDIPSFMWAYNPHAGTTVRDLPGARALLDAAGWRVGPDGIRTRNGQRLSLQIAYRTESVTDRGRGVLLVSLFREAGIDVTLKGYTTALLYGPVGTGILASGKYQGGLLTWFGGIDPDDSSQLLCSERPPKGYNWTRYCNPEMDAAQHLALTHYDRPTRKRAYDAIQSLLARDNPYVYIWWQRQIESINDNLKGFRPNGIIEDWNAWQWSI
jgi:peptide/nickel transport system substrate-binding protein